MRFYLSFILLFSISIVYGQTEYSICEIQGPGELSSYDGETVKTRGVVTADFTADDKLKGFFMQSDCIVTLPSSSGIFVYTGTESQMFNVGDEVELVAEVKEYFDLTELTNITEFAVLSSGNSIEPSVITLPLGRRGDLELVEGMYVKFEQELFVTDHYNLGRYGELSLSSDGPRSIPTQIVDPNDSDPSGENYAGATNVFGIAAQLEANTNNYIILDDGSTQQFPSSIPFLDEDDETLTIGSSIEELEGVISYSFGEYRLMPTKKVEFDLEDRADQISFVGTIPPMIKVCAFNVLNYFTTLDVWGAETDGELERQTNKIVNTLEVIEADIFGLMEIENNGDVAHSKLLNAVNSRLDFVRNYEVLDADDTGSFNTKSVIFFDDLSVEPVGPLYATDPAQFERPSLAQVFRPKGETEGEFLYVLNHLRFKGCDGAEGANQDQNDGQACFNQRRKDQVNALINFIDDIRAQTGVEAVFVMGDMNAYYQEDPIDLFRSNGYQSYFDEDESSFLFQGELGALDHAMLNADAAEKTYAGQIFHINSAEPRFLDYSDDNISHYQDNIYRSSDHDPVILWINRDKLLSNGESIVEGQFSIQVFPNPSSGVLNLKVPESMQINEISLYDLEGKMHMELDAKSRTFDLGNLLPATYFIEIRSGEELIVRTWVKAD